MTTTELQSKLAELLALPTETEWVEFKHNNSDPQAIGEYLSALSNGAALHGKRNAYIVWGVEDGSHNIVGTTFRPRQQRNGDQPLENWLMQLLYPRIEFTIHEFEHNGLKLVMFKIQAASHIPVRFAGNEYVRVGSAKRKLRDFPEKERRLWQVLSGEHHEDWSAQIVEGATLAHLDPQAIQFARAEYQIKHPQHAVEVPEWDNEKFLNKAKVCLEGRITNTALLLLGKDEAGHFLAPAFPQITWVLQDENRIAKDYQHFGLPFILASDLVRAKIRNLTIRYLPRETLFPNEVTQYDPWVLRETLHNCIAHQDYQAGGGRISVVERSEFVLFTNLGSFIPGTVEEMIRRDVPPVIYRNPFLAQAMVNLNMIDTIGSGIKRIFLKQRERNFPMPDYDLSNPNEVQVKLTGQILDENYTNVLLENTHVDLMDVIALDKVQKKRVVSNEEFNRLKKQKLVEGRRSNPFISAKIAAVTGDKATYIKQRAFDKAHYKKMIKAYLEKFSEASRQELDELLLTKLSDTLNEVQKKKFVENLLQDMKKEGLLRRTGIGRKVKWHLSESKIALK